MPETTVFIETDESIIQALLEWNWDIADARKAVPLIRGFCWSPGYGADVQILWKEGVTVEQIQEVMG